MLIRNNEAQAPTVIPAVDLLGEDAVRLERGDYERVLLRESDPEALVARFAEAGAQLIHVVDLDGARSGSIRPEVIGRLVKAAGAAEVQASGGVRTPEDAVRLVEAGAARVVVGTAAFAAPEAVSSFVDTLGERLVVAVDARQGAVVVGGWMRETPWSAGDAAAHCEAEGVARILCTAVDRDGTLGGPDLGLLADVRSRSSIPLLAAGGIRSREDVAAVGRIGCEGAIVGRALLDGSVPLSILQPP